MSVPLDEEPIEQLAREAAAVPLLGEPIGAYLAGHRRLRGISLVELSNITLIPLRSLERLEQGSFDGQADGFVRGFVRTVAQALGLDPDETVARLRTEPGAGGSRHRVEKLSLPRVLAVGAAAALVVGFFVLADALIRSPSRGGAATAGSGSGAPTTVRRDPVRALADAQGIYGARESAALAVVPPRERPTARPSPVLLEEPAAHADEKLRTR